MINIIGLLKYGFQKDTERLYFLYFLEERSNRMSSSQITMVSLDELVSSNHQYRKFKDLFDFNAAHYYYFELRWNLCQKYIVN